MVNSVLHQQRAHRGEKGKKQCKKNAEPEGALVRLRVSKDACEYWKIECFAADSCQVDGGFILRGKIKESGIGN
jgi:uncharacterized Fe-S cluster-containing protein